MFNMGMTEMLIIAAIGLIVIGPTKLPSVMRAIGRGLAEFRKASSEFKNTVSREFEDAAGPEVKELTEMADKLKRRNIATNLESYLDTAAKVIEGAPEEKKDDKEQTEKELTNSVSGQSSEEDANISGK